MQIKHKIVLIDGPYRVSTLGNKTHVRLTIFTPPEQNVIITKITLCSNVFKFG